MANVLMVKERVRTILTEEFGTIDVDSDGDFSLRNGSARIFVRVSELGEDSTVVRLFCQLVEGATPSDELFHYVAMEGGNYYFGHLAVAEREDGSVGLFFMHRLLGDLLDPEELVGAVIGMLSSADDIDDEVVGRFGGRRFHED